MNPQEFKKPTKCILWNKAELTTADLDFEPVKTITESSHFDRNILKCKECGQLYFHEFYEHVNFGGEDDMYDTWIPVESEEEIKVLTEAETPMDLLQFSPRLHWAFSGGKREPIRWIGKEDAIVIADEKIVPLPKEKTMAMTQKIQTGFMATLTALTVPIMILNLLGGIISGIWLAILGEWGEIFRGILFMVISGFAISIALMPSLLFAAPAAMAIEKGKKLLGMFFGSLSVLYTIALMTVWCIWIMWLFVSSATDSSLIPLLIWSYGVALAPWMYLAQKDQQDGGGNEYSMFTIFFAQISYILGMILFFLGATLGTIAFIFGAIMLTGGILQVFIAFGGEIKKSFSKKEVKEAFEILEEASKKFAFASYGFDLVKAHAEKSILSEAKQLTKSVQSGKVTVRKYVYSLITYISGNLVSSGQYHIYRGVLSPMGPGEDLLKILDSGLDELVAMGDVSKEEAAEQKEVVRKNIEEMG